MNCTEARRQWMLYLDSEGDPDLLLRIRAHLEECSTCADWFARQQRLEQAVRAQVAGVRESPELWGRVLAGSGLCPPVAGRMRWPVLGGMLTAAALLLAVVLGLWHGEHRPSSELAREAAAWHERCLRGEVKPEFVSASDQEVDRYLKSRLPFRVHCPPRTDMNFAVQGAGVCLLKDRQQAAYIVGHVEEATVSILVLDRSSLAAFPRARSELQGGRHHFCREDGYAMVSGVVADNLVVVIGAASPDALEKLLNAYGTYPDG
jgi:anti-sigma factor RsiW